MGPWAGEESEIVNGEWESKAGNRLLAGCRHTEHEDGLGKDPQEVLDSGKYSYFLEALPEGIEI